MKIIRKVGTVLGVAVLTSAALFLLGVATALAGNMAGIHLGEYGPWLPLIGLEYGFVLGIVIGVIVAIKKAAAQGAIRRRTRNYLTWKKDMTPEEAAEVIERFLEGISDSIEWCDFAEARQQDARVERYRKRCDKLSPMVNRPGEMDEVAVAELRSIIEALRSLGRVHSTDC